MLRGFTVEDGHDCSSGRARVSASTPPRRHGSGNRVAESHGVGVPTIRLSSRATNAALLASVATRLSLSGSGPSAWHEPSTVVAVGVTVRVGVLLAVTANEAVAI